MKATFIIGVLIALFHSNVAAQWSPLRMFVSVTEYFGETYAEAPRGGALCVYLTGEPVKVRLRVANPDSIQNELRFARRRSTTTEPFSVDVLRDGLPTRIAVQISEPLLMDVNGASRAIDRESVPLAPHEEVVWEANLGDSLPPGLYRLAVRLDARDQDFRLVPARVSTFVFEVRLRAPDLRAEVTRRTAYRLFAAGEYDGAEEAARELQRLNPGSYEAHLIRAYVAEGRGAGQMARTELQQALRAVTGNLDPLLLKYRGPAQIQRLIRGIESRVLRQ